MRTASLIITFLCIYKYASGQYTWNMQDKAGYIGYLIEPRFMIDRKPVFPKKEGLSIVLYPTDHHMHFLVDTSERPDFLKYFSTIAADYITNDSSDAINNFYLTVEHPDYEAKYEFSAKPLKDRSVLVATNAGIIRERLNMLAKILPFNCYIVVRGVDKANVDIELDITEWIKSHRGFDFSEYSLVLASVLYDYPLAKAERFTQLFLRYIDHDNVRPNRRVRSYSLNFQGKKIARQYRRHATYLSLKTPPGVVEAQTHQKDL
ncbi:hypothetical protein L3C95_25215 [Chitinophaga filiformis]|uniref:hypothetical protein n=1 Tax=Chitinophaga filiformis TaxID=104663 RepID=UPI001F33FC42|nr:hypothetical protein [Chitinophaga filiformis]MCF6406220.1 hypothetical protein [Chitinophaga filiformis]